MSAFVTEKRSELLIDGYIREHSDSFNLVLPMELITIVWKYQISFRDWANEMTDQYDTFDPLTKHSAYTIDGDTIIRNGGVNPFIFGKMKIDRGVTIWKFKCLHPVLYWVGVTGCSKITKEEHNIHTGKTHMVHLLCAQNGYLYPRNDQSNREWDIKSTTYSFSKAGDIICVMLDMNQRTVSFALNGRDFECGFKNIDTG
eukprot:392506_1